MDRSNESIKDRNRREDNERRRQQQAEHFETDLRLRFMATPGATLAEWEKQKGKILSDTRAARVERQQEQAGRAHLDLARKYF